MRQGTSRRCVDLLADGVAPSEAIRIALAELYEDEASRVDGLAGLIVVNAAGEIALGHDTPAMSAGWIRPGSVPTVSLGWH
jgi:isoaspartyl peptidase/L-asparaginase-like protein (Ntn-hydrolase superfamily)